MSSNKSTDIPTLSAYSSLITSDPCPPAGPIITFTFALLATKFPDIPVLPTMTASAYV